MTWLYLICFQYHTRQTININMDINIQTTPDQTTVTVTEDMEGQYWKMTVDVDGMAVQACMEMIRVYDQSVILSEAVRWTVDLL